MNVIQREYAFHTVIISLSQVSVSITFLRILMRIHIPVKEVQLKSTKREKSQISSLTPHLFLTGEINMNKNKFLMEIFFPSRNTRLSRHNSIFFNVILKVIPCHLQRKIPLYFIFLVVY